MGGTIVCGVADTPDGRSAAELARALGARLGLRLVLVHVIDGLPAGGHDSLTARQRQTGAEQILNGIAREIGNGTEKRVVPLLVAPPATRPRSDHRLSVVAAGSSTR